MLTHAYYLLHVSSILFSITCASDLHGEITECACQTLTYHSLCSYQQCGLCDAGTVDEEAGLSLAQVGLDSRACFKADECRSCSRNGCSSSISV